VTGGPGDVAALVAAIEPYDDTERAQQADVLAWLASTPDVYRRVKPATPPRHLVSYAVLASPRDGHVFLVDHRLAGLWLPAGGHVEPREEPAATAEREAREELAWWTGPQLASADPARFDPNMGRFLAKLRSLAGIRGQPRA
jgi:hypothetical protein